MSRKHVRIQQQPVSEGGFDAPTDSFAPRARRNFDSGGWLQHAHFRHGEGHGHGHRAQSLQAPVDDTPTETPAPAQTIDIQSETVHVVFEAKGSVDTADGRHVDFQDKLELSQQFVHSTAGDQQDAAGKADSAPLLTPGSGLLFADKNADGVANDSTELFGSQSGNGFAELAKQDSDGNGWIDEGDPVFRQLRVWVQYPNGPGATYSLADLGIGAIYAAGVGTAFGQIRSTGIYLKENGEAGIMQQVDLAA